MSTKPDLLGALMLTLAVTVTDSAFAQSGQTARLCSGGADITLDQQVEACTTIIDAPAQDWKILASAFSNRGLAYTSIGDYARAVSDYTRSIELDPRADAYFGRGYAYHRSKQFARAIEDYDRALTLDPSHSGAEQNRQSAIRLARFLGELDAIKASQRGDAFFKAEKYDDAIRAYDEALKIDPDRYTTILSRGEAYQKKADFDRALADFNRAIELDPKDALAFHYRAGLWEQRGDFSRAASDLEQAIERDEEIDGLEHAILSGYYVKLKEYERALSAIRKAYEYDGDDASPLVRYETGIILQELGRHGEAVPEFSVYIARTQRDAVAFYRRGLSYEWLGDRQMALDDFKRFFELADARDWAEAGKTPGEAEAKLAEYGLRR